MCGAIPRLAILGSIRKLAIQAMRSKPVNSTPPCPLQQYCPQVPALKVTDRLSGGWVNAATKMLDSLNKWSSLTYPLLQQGLYSQYPLTTEQAFDIAIPYCGEALLSSELEAQTVRLCLCFSVPLPLYFHEASGYAVLTGATLKTVFQKQRFLLFFLLFFFLMLLLSSSEDLGGDMYNTLTTRDRVGIGQNREEDVAQSYSMLLGISFRDQVDHPR